MRHKGLYIGAFNVYILKLILRAAQSSTKSVATIKPEITIFLVRYGQFFTLITRQANGFADVHCNCTLVSSLSQERINSLDLIPSYMMKTKIEG